MVVLQSFYVKTNPLKMSNVCWLICLKVQPRGTIQCRVFRICSSNKINDPIFYIIFKQSVPHGVTFVICVSVSITHFPQCNMSAALQWLNVITCSKQACASPHTAGPFHKFSRRPELVGLHGDMYGIKIAAFLRKGPQQDWRVWSAGRQHALFTSHFKITLTKLMKIHSLSWTALKITFLLCSLYLTLK
jgi:hypothetical protein